MSITIAESARALAMNFPADLKIPDAISDLERDLDALISLIRQHAVESVIHLAARIGVLSDAEPHISTLVNVVGTSNVLEAARLTGIHRVVLASSIMRQAGRGLPHLPGDYPAPRNLYGATKLCSDKLFVAANNIAGGHRTRFSVVPPA